MTSIYHITDISNLSSIIACGGLLCDRDVIHQDLTVTSIAHDNIKERRKKTVVRAGPGGTLDHYVPFYFCPRSPMLYTIHRGNVVGYTNGQRSVVHLVASAEEVVAMSLQFAFTTGHATMALSDYYDNLDRLDEIDWNVVQDNWWNDTEEHPDRSRRKQAEFLVQSFAPWELVSEIGVINDEMASRVAALIEVAEHQPSIVVHRDWYYY